MVFGFENVGSHIFFSKSALLGKRALRFTKGGPILARETISLSLGTE